MIGVDMENQDLTPMVSQGKWFSMLEDQATPAHPLFSKFFYGPPDPHRDSSFKRSVGPFGKGLCPFWNPIGLFFDQ